MLWNQEKQVFDFLLDVLFFFVASALYLLSRYQVKISLDRYVNNISKKMNDIISKKDVASNLKCLVSHVLLNWFPNWNNHKYFITHASFWYIWYMRQLHLTDFFCKSDEIDLLHSEFDCLNCYSMVRRNFLCTNSVYSNSFFILRLFCLKENLFSMACRSHIYYIQLFNKVLLKFTDNALCHYRIAIGYAPVILHFLNCHS